MSHWKPDVCVFHGKCDDGFGAAYVVWKKYGDAVDFVPGSYGKPLSGADYAGKRVLFVDFSLKRDAMIAFAESGPDSVVVLDHHKTAEAELSDWNVGPVMAGALTKIKKRLEKSKNKIVAHFDMERSGAAMTWRFFNGRTAMPKMLQYIEDRDLWKFSITGTAEFSAALRTIRQDFLVWNGLMRRTETARMLEDGAIILRGHRKNVREFCDTSYTADICGYTVPVVNVPYHYASDCAHELMLRNKTAPFAAAWFRRGDTVQYSLRSMDEREDVSEIAKKFGGGGHRNAAGYQVRA